METRFRCCAVFTLIVLGIPGGLDAANATSPRGTKPGANVSLAPTVTADNSVYSPDGSTTIAASAGELTNTDLSGSVRGSPPVRPAQYAPDEILFKLVDLPQRGTSQPQRIQEALQVVAERHGLYDTTRMFPQSVRATLRGVQRAHLPAGVSPIEAANTLALDPAIEWAEPNYYRHLDATPDDPLYASEQSPYLGSIGLPAAWDVTTGSPDVIIAIIDTGVQWDHPDFAGEHLAEHQ